MDTVKRDQEYLKGLTVLYVEDDEESRQQFTEYLSRLAGTLLTAANGAEGLEVFRRHHPQIVITDIVMPVMDGLAMADMIRTDDSSVPIIILSAFDTADYMTRAITIGINGYVVKPESSLRLHHALVACAHQLRVEDELRRSEQALRESRDTILRQVEERTAELRASEELYRMLFHNAADAIFLHDFEGRIVSANEMACRLYGYAPQAFLELSIDDIDVPEQAMFIPDRMAAVENYGKVSFEGIHRDASGRRIQVEVHASRVIYQGRPCLLSICRDITERKLIEDMLLKSEARHRILFEATIDAILIIDQDGVIDCNPAAVTLFGASGRDALSGRRLDELSPGEQPDGRPSPAVLRESMELAQARGTHNFEWQHNRLDTGAPFIAEVRLTPVELNGQSVLSATVRDITERRRLEEQLRHSQKLEAVGQLAGGVAHDFNNVLTVISGYCGLLSMSGSLNAQQLEQIEQIEASAERAAQLTHGLLAFSRKQALVFKQVDLNDIVQHVQKFLFRLIGEDIQFSSVCCRTSLPLLADSGQIEQVLINLVTNARDAMPKGGQLNIRTGLEVMKEPFKHAQGYGEPGRYAVITVSDTGTGISREDQERIFEPFFTTKEVGKGTGLGMSIVFGIVKQHNGFISVTSERGVGTAFRVYLPVVSQESQAAGDEQGNALPRGGSETILLVEDDGVVRRMEAMILGKFGYTVIEASNGQEAVEAFARDHERISLVLMDMIMPKMSGLEAYSAMSRIRPGIKVVYLSGYTADFMNNRGLSGEGIELVTKPIQTVQLLRKIREQLDPPHSAARQG